MPELPLSEHVSIQPAIYLEYGVDGVCGDDTGCEVCERGMRFYAPWRFEIGSLLRVAFAIEGSPVIRIETEGVVAECARQEQRRYLTTLAFIEAPRELRASLGKVSARLISSSLWQSPKGESPFSGDSPGDPGNPGDAQSGSLF